MDAFSGFFRSILEATSWRALAIAIGCGVVIALDQNEILKLDAIVFQFVAIAAILSGCLAVVGSIVNLVTLFSVKERVLAWNYRRSASREFRDHIPHLTEHERQILSYLLTNNSKTFTCDADGGYANTLISKGFVRFILRPNQEVRWVDVPAEVPDHIWNVMLERKNDFAFKGDIDGPHPWRIPWMVR